MFHFLSLNLKKKKKKKFFPKLLKIVFFFLFSSLFLSQTIKKKIHYKVWGWKKMNFLKFRDKKIKFRDQNNILPINFSFFFFIFSHGKLISLPFFYLMNLKEGTWHWTRSKLAVRGWIRGALLYKNAHGSS